MSTCSTATSAAIRGHDESPRRRGPPAGDDVEAVHGRLERRLVDLERDWDAYKTGHRHRRSRSATGTPSSAVTVAAPEDGILLLLPLYHRYSSPRNLLSSLQQTSSADSDCAGEIVFGAAGSSPAGSDGEGPSSVSSVQGGYAAAASSSSCSCRCRCTVCHGGYSTSSSCTGDAAPSFSLAAGGALEGEGARKCDEGRSVVGAGSAAWIFAAIVLVVMGFVAMVILELSVDDGRAEYLVPT